MTSALTLSVLMCLVSALCYAVGAMLQERVAVAARRPAVHATLCSGLWWTALTLNGGGGLLHVLALRWGPLTLVQPLGALTIVFALPLSALGPGRGTGRAGRTAWAGVGLVAGGLAVLTAMVDTGPDSALPVRDQPVIAALGIAGVVLLAVAATRVTRAAGRSALLAAAAGVAFGVASFHIKAVVDGWGVLGTGAEAVGLCLTAVLAVAGLAASQASYRDAGLSVPLVTATLVNPVVASLIGVAAMDDGFRYGVPGLVLVAVAATTAAVGLVALVRDRAGREGTERPRGSVLMAAGAPRASPVAVGEAGAAGVPRPSPEEARVPRGSPGERVPCLSAHGRESPDATRGQSCTKSPYVSQ
ncbi:DMT family transporter [Streptomyces sp. NBC_00728]|uniref:DMT family transporter n=1 Tax=Streptomyces sp. NBC_00728 TaxID=2903676 RepID=UPI0038672CDE